MTYKGDDKMNLKRLALASTIALTTVLTPMMALETSAAIPCTANPLIETPDTQIMPLIYRQLPIHFEDLMRGSAPVERPELTMTPFGEGEDASPAADERDNAAIVRGSAEALLRCMDYGDPASFLTSATPHFRAFRVGIGDPEASKVYLDAGSGVRAITVFHGQPLDDGRWVVDYSAIVDGDHYIAGEMVFVAEGEFFYLDDAYLTTEATLNGETIEIRLNEISTREIKIYEVAQGDRVVWTNESESNVDIQVADAEGLIVFNGHVGGTTLVGGEDRNVLPIVNLAPGEYTITTTFQESDIIYTATLIVAE